MAIAYHACSLPKKNGLWFYDFGVSIGLWISAFESLVHPGRGGKSELKTVLDLLSKVQFFDAVTKRRRTIKSGREIGRKCNAAEYLYWQLYQARNAFLHGNPVTARNALYKNGSGHIKLTQIAPLLYQIALLCHLGALPESPRSKLNIFKRQSALRNLEKGLRRILTGKREA